MAKTIKFNGQFYSIAALSRATGVPVATLWYRLTKAEWSVKKAVETPVVHHAARPVVAFGIDYPSLSAAAKASGRDPEVTRHHVNSGMTLEEALLKHDDRTKHPLEVLGRDFESIAELARHYGIRHETLYSRLRQGWSPQRAVLDEVNTDKQVSAFGESFPSIAALARHHAKPYGLMHKRIVTYGWDPERAVSLPLKLGRQIDIEGKVFPSIEAAADHFGIAAATAVYRLGAGYSTSDAFDPRLPMENRRTIQVAGCEYPSVCECARAFGIKENTLLKRLRSSWTIEQAVGLDDPPDYESRMGPAPVSVSEYRDRLSAVHGDELDFSNAEFGKALEKVSVICLRKKGHPSFRATPNNLLRGRGCPRCSLSIGAKRVARWLEVHGFDFEPEWTGHGLRGSARNAALRFDFSVKNPRCLIEFDGLQHFEPVDFGRLTLAEAERAFRSTRRNDTIKNDWARQAAIPMLRIRYDEDDNVRLNEFFEELLRRTS